MNNNCDIPGKCSCCGEHVYCVNSRYFKRLSPRQGLRDIVAKAIHSENDNCDREQSWDEAKKSGYECGCFPMADIVLDELYKALRT